MTHRVWLSALTALTLLAPLVTAQDTQPAQASQPETEALSLPLRNGDAWVFDFDLENDVATHRLTGFSCPFDIPGGYGLVSIVQAGRHGAPAQCTYTNENTGGFTSLSVNFIFSEEPAITSALRRLSLSEGFKVLNQDDLKSEVFKADFNGVPVEDCHRVYLPFFSGDIAKHEKIEACNFGKWVFIINQTAPMNDTSFAEITSWAKTAETNMADNLDNCIAPITTPATEITADTPGNADLLVDVLKGEVILRATLADTSAIWRLSGDKCMIAYLNSEQADLLIMRDKSRDISPLGIYPATLKGIDQAPTIWVAETLAFNAGEDAPKTYAMFGQGRSGIHHIHKLYQGAPPNDEQFIQDAQLLFTGKLPSRAYLEQTEPGKWTWHIPPTE